jgi:hypothetical protein
VPWLYFSYKPAKQAVSTAGVLLLVHLQQLDASQMTDGQCKTTAWIIKVLPHLADKRARAA